MSEVSKPNDGLCVFCGRPYAEAHWDGGHNPEPLYPYEEARACGECNYSLVIPARLGTTIISPEGVWAPPPPGDER